MVNRSISSKSFFGVLGLMSPSSPVSVLMILLSSSSGVVRNVSESLLGMVGVELLAMLERGGLTEDSEIPPLSAAASCWGKVWMCLNLCTRELARLETADGGGSDSFSSMFASLTNTQDVPNRTMLFSTFSVIIPK